MKFDVAIAALDKVTWDWSEGGFESILAKLGLEREEDADAEMPHYSSPWGKEWVQAIIHDGAVERVEFLIEDTSPGRSGFSPAKLEALERKYRDKLAGYVKRATTVLGAPAFHGGYGATGFPDDEDANALAMWRRASGRIMLMARNEGPDTPFWISIVVKPAAATRAPTARASRPVMRAPTRQSSLALDAALGARFDSAIKRISAMRWNWSAPDLAQTIAEIGMPSTGDLTRVEIILESKQPGSDGFSTDEIDDLQREYFEKHEMYVQRAQQILGKPKFYDGMARKGYPQDEPAMVLALWRLKKARLMITQQGGAYADKPFSIAIVVKP